MPEDSTRRSFLTAAGTGLAAALAGCGGNAPNQTETESPTPTPGDGTQEPTDDSSAQAGGTLRLMAPGSIQTLDPINAKGSGAGYDQYGRSLMEYPNGTYPPQPALAESYEISDDRLTYTFKLKEGVKFHNGKELTAADVVYSFRRLAGSPNSRNQDDIIGETMTIAHEKDPAQSAPEDETTLGDYVPGSLAVEATDKYTFEMTLASAFPWTLFQIAGGAFAILPEGCVGDVEGYEGEYEYNEYFSTANGGPKYAGLGPFKVESWTKGSQIKLTAFEDYYGEGPKIDGITYTVVTSGNTRLNRFRNKNADILNSMPRASFNPDNVSIERTEGNRSVGTYTFGDGQEVNYGEIPSLSTDYFVFNCKRVPIPVRKATAYALNQEEVANTVYKGTAQPGYHITPPAPYPTFEEGNSGTESYYAHAETGAHNNLQLAADGYPYGYGETRLEAARKVMEEAGYGENNRYSITATNISGNSEYRQVLTRLQSKLRSAYIDMEITEAEFGTIISQAIAGKMDLFALGDGMEYPGPENFLRFLHAGNPSGAFTRWGAKDSYSDPELVETAQQAWQENYAAEDATDETKAEAFQTVEEVNWGSVQELPIAHTADQRFWHKRVNVEMYGVMENQTYTDLTLSK